jgi:hypothetical protein
MAFFMQKFIQAIGGSLVGKVRFLCGKAELFHIFHRVLHKAFPQGVPQGLYIFCLHNSYTHNSTLFPLFRLVAFSPMPSFCHAKFGLDKIFSFPHLTHPCRQCIFFEKYAKFFEIGD